MFDKIISKFLGLDLDLIKAANDSSIEAVQKLLDRGANGSAKDEYGWTALMRATDNGKVGIAKILLDAGTDINAENNNNCTAIMLAGRNGYTWIFDIVEV